MFSLIKHPCKIDGFNPRAEKHGDENVPAGDIKFTTRVHSSVLDQFDKSYRPFLFRTAASSGDQVPLLPGDTLTELAKPKLKPLSLKEDFPGYTLIIGSGADIAEPLRITEVELSSFIFDAMSGGSVGLTFSASFKHDVQARRTHRRRALPSHPEHRRRHARATAGQRANSDRRHRRHARSAGSGRSRSVMATEAVAESCRY